MARETLPPEPKPKMPASKAAFALILAVILDAIKAMCEALVLFAPVLVGAGVTAKWGAVAGAVADTVAGVAETFGGAPVVEIFGIILAMAIGFSGWLFFIVWFLFSRVKLLGEPSRLLAVLFGFLLSETPFLGAGPTFTVPIWRIVRSVQKEDAAARAAWETKTAALRARIARETAERERAYLVQQQAANDATDEEAAVQEAAVAEAADLTAAEAANDANFNTIPETLPKAA